MEKVSGPDWHYMGLYLNDDAGMMSKNQSNLMGNFLTQWWDQSDDAGPKQRPRSDFSETQPQLEVLAVANGTVKKLNLIYCT